jgi:hypothetical protein
MIQRNLLEADDLWSRLVAAETASTQARRDFFAPGVDRVALLRQALASSNGAHRAIALALLRQLQPAEQQALFPELIRAARAAHGPLEGVRSLILALPRDWVLARIHQEVEPILAEEQYDDYWMFLELFDQMDRNLTEQLARRAASSSDQDTRELGEDYLRSR